MKQLKYVCDNCEDNEYWNEVLPYGAHCECGGHLHLTKYDNFVRIENFTDCMICVNKGTEECVDCKRN